MRWGLDKGPHTKTLEAARKQLGRAVPMLEDRPEIYEHLVLEWEAFCRLDQSRMWIMGIPQPITFQEIIAYLEIYAPTCNFAEIADTVRLLDLEYRSWHREKRDSGGTQS